MHEQHSRSIVKAISYRILSILVDTIFVYAITRKVDMTLGIVVITNTYSTFLYYIHERVWNKLHFGRKIIRNAVSKVSSSKVLKSSNKR